MRLFEVLCGVFVLTLPFGFYRASTRRLSLRWFLAIHVPVPLVFLLRVGAGLSYAFIPATALAFAVGQFSGGTLGRSWIRRHAPLESATAEVTPGFQDEVGDQPK